LSGGKQSNTALENSRNSTLCSSKITFYSVSIWPISPTTL